MGDEPKAEHNPVSEPRGTSCFSTRLADSDILGVAGHPSPPGSTMSAANATGDSGPSAVDIVSSVGTWIAAFIAVVALIGVVGPFLALQASLSDDNRAMNAVQDLPQKYVTRGYHLTRGLRVMRKIRVPNLSPGYIANEPDTAPLVPLRATLSRWAIRSRDYLPWNTGWAKLSELIEAYEPHDGATNRPVTLGVKSGGSLEVVNGRTALVVSKHWILLLGLLGRYGTRSDKGVLQKTGVRRDFEGERASLRHFRLTERRVRRHPGPEFDWVKKDRRSSYFSGSRSPSRSRSRSRSESSSSDERDIEITPDSNILSFRRSEYGEWTLEKENLTISKIHGVTGMIQGLGRHKGSWSYLTAISFVPHTAREMFPHGTQTKVDASSMETLFWLAHGFLPCSRTPEGQQTVISLESPTSEASMPLELMRGMSIFEDQPAFSLQESDGIPISLGNAMKRLNIPEPKILQFLPLEDRDRRGLADKDELLRYDGTLGEHDGAWSERETDYDSEPVMISGTWVHFTKYKGNLFWVFPRKDIERALGLIFSLDWDDWGFLTWKDMFWTSMLKPATKILNERYLRTLPFSDSLDLPVRPKAFRWKVQSKFHPQKTADYLELDQNLSLSFEESETLPLRLALGTLYILDAPFRDMVSRACEALAEYEGHESRKRPAKTETMAKIGALEEQMHELVVQHVRELQSRHPGPMDTKKHTKIPAQSVEIVSLRNFGFSYVHHMDAGHIIIQRLVPKWELEFLFAHTAKYREAQRLRNEGDKKRTGVLEYNYASKRLKWYFDQETRTEHRMWHLNGDLTRAPSSEKVVFISEKDIALIALWTANRAAMWLSSQDSKPLLKFVDELDPYVYVL